MDLISSQLAEERAAKISFEQRATSGVTWAGGLVAASLALVSSTLPETAAVIVFAAAVLLVGAAYIGTRVITPSAYREAELEKLRTVIADPAKMTADEQIGLHRVAEQSLEILEAARAANQRKAVLLRWELRYLAAGTGALALAVGQIALV